MTRRPLLPLLAFAVALSGGCVFGKKPARPKESTSLTEQTEDSLRQRWIEKRATELVAQGAAAEAAHAQAAEEFRTKYRYTGAAQK